VQGRQGIEGTARLSSRCPHVLHNNCMQVNRWLLSEYRKINTAPQHPLFDHEARVWYRGSTSCEVISLVCTSNIFLYSTAIVNLLYFPSFMVEIPYWM